MKNQLEIVNILTQVEFKDHWFYLQSKGDGYLLQLRYLEGDVDTGKLEEQHARKWYISSHADESEIVRTALAACLRSAEHRVREHFTYKGVRVFDPHVSIDALAEVSNRKATRDPQQGAS